MTTYLSPGVYVEEVPSGPQPIAAAPTSVVAVLGTTRRLLDGTPARRAEHGDDARGGGCDRLRPRGDLLDVDAG